MENVKNNIYDPVFLNYGMKVYSSEYIDHLRKDPEAKDKYIIPNKGHQEEFLTTKAQIAIYSGKRGSGKSAALNMTPYQYINDEFFSGVVFRNEKNDSNGTGGIATSSKPFLSPFGIYKSSLSNMKWDFYKGGTLSYEYYSDTYKKFCIRYRGREFPYIGIDEISQIPFSHFTFLFSCNRNSHGYPNIIRGACNPEKGCWVFQFLKGEYLDEEGNPHPKFLTEDGFVIEENNGKVLYFYKYGDRPDECYWGDTKKAVYNQGKHDMDMIFNSDSSYKKIIGSPENLALSFTLISGDTSDNPAVMNGNGEYVSKMGMMSREDKEKDLIGRWTEPTYAETLVSINDMNAFFYNKEYKINDFNCITVDVSGSGRGDPETMMYWEGFHLVDAELVLGGGETQKMAVTSFAERHGVPMERICFDATGLGSVYEEYFKGAVNFVAKFPAFDKKPIKIGGKMQEYSNYENVRGQVYDNLANRIKARGYSVERSLLNKRLNGRMLIDHFKEEYPAIARKETNEYKFQALPKDDMKQRIGHSPDFIDCWSLREYIELFFEKKREVRRIGAWWI